MRLRPYQLRVVEQVFEAWSTGVDRVAISAATGSGKSVIFGEIARRHLQHHRDAGPVVLLAHRRELITQAAEHFRRANPDLDVRTVVGSPGRQGSAKRQAALSLWRQADVLVTTVQTLGSASTLRDFPDPSLVIADEAHHSPAPQWSKVMTALGCWSGTRSLGVTATPFREDHRLFSDTWPVMAAAVDIAWLIMHNDHNGVEYQCDPGDGYLVPPSLRHLLVDGLDLRQVPTSRRSGAVDFRETELATALQDSGAFDLVAQAVVTELPDRKGVIFAPTVASSSHLAKTLTQAGAPCHHVDGTMDTRTRDRLIGDFRDDRVRWLANVNIVSEGFDIPEIDAVVLARPTQSRIFFRQAVGRSLRPAPGKSDAVILDVAGASDGHSLAGVAALTDHDVLDATGGESLLALLERSDRARRGVRDRIKATVDDASRLLTDTDRSVEQIRTTVDGLPSDWKGMQVFVERAEAVAGMVGEALETVTRQTTDDATLDELTERERRCDEELQRARQRYCALDQIKATIRETLHSMRDDPTGDVATAMVTGHIATAAGELFGSWEDFARPSPPSEAGRLKARNGRTPRVTHPARYGWALRSPAGHLFVPIHDEHNPQAEALAVSVDLGQDKWLPVLWRSYEVTELALSPLSVAWSYEKIVKTATAAGTVMSYVDPQARWRRKPAQLDSPQVALARRLAPGHRLPEGATAGYVSDLITLSRQGKTVDSLAKWVAQQSATVLQ